jgi:hypothetical protein
VFLLLTFIHVFSDEDSFKTDKVGKDPTPLPLKELDSKEFVLLRFGQFVVDSLCVALRETPLKIEISASIPAKVYYTPNITLYHCYANKNVIRHKPKYIINNYCNIIIFLFTIEQTASIH